jgi:hypothetical protein
LNELKSIAVFSENRSKIVRVIDEKFDVINLIAPVEFGEKPSCRLFMRLKRPPHTVPPSVPTQGRTLPGREALKHVVEAAL